MCLLLRRDHLGGLLAKDSPSGQHTYYQTYQRDEHYSQPIAVRRALLRLLGQIAGTLLQTVLAAGHLVELMAIHIYCIDHARATRTELYAIDEHDQLVALFLQHDLHRVFTGEVDRVVEVHIAGTYHANRHMHQVGLADIHAVAVGHLTIVDIQAIRHVHAVLRLDLDHLVADQSEPLQLGSLVTHRIVHHQFLLHLVGTGYTSQHAILAERNRYLLTTCQRYRCRELTAVDIQGHAAIVQYRRKHYFVKLKFLHNISVFQKFPNLGAKVRFFSHIRKRMRVKMQKKCIF